MTISLPFTVISHSESDTEQIGASLGKYLIDSGNSSSFIAMYGDLGAGKTAFVRGLASAVTPCARVCSPTYTVVNEYRGDGRRLCHFDMYRIESDDDLWSIGFYDYGNCMIVAEWCEKIPFALPEHYVSVRIEKINETERKIQAEWV